MPPALCQSRNTGLPVHAHCVTHTKHQGDVRDPTPRNGHGLSCFPGWQKGIVDDHSSSLRQLCQAEEDRMPTGRYFPSLHHQQSQLLYRTKEWHPESLAAAHSASHIMFLQYPNHVIPEQDITNKPGSGGPSQGQFQLLFARTTIKSRARGAGVLPKLKPDQEQGGPCVGSRTLTRAPMPLHCHHFCSA